MKLDKSKFTIHADEKNEVKRMCIEIFDNNCYLPAFGRKVIVDVGACIGLFSMYAYPLATQIYAIEPHPISYKNLVKNVKDNKLNNIQTFNYAISDKNGMGWISNPGTLEGSLFNFGGGMYPVEAKTLSTFFNDQHIQYADIVKMDIEGGEFPILRSQEIYDVLPKIGCIILEAHYGLALPKLDGWIAEDTGGAIYLIHRI